jgi:hypothetical protein
MPLKDLIKGEDEENPGLFTRIAMELSVQDTLALVSGNFGVLQDFRPKLRRIIHDDIMGGVDSKCKFLT